MYPSLYHIFQDILGVEWSALRFINTFGFFMALAFFVGLCVAKRELKRREKEGFIEAVPIKRLVGQKVSIGVLVLYALIGFVLGYKLIGIFLSDEANGQAYIQSLEGSWFGGLIIAIILTYMKYTEQKKQELPKPEMKTFMLSPYMLMENILILFVVTGIVGAKVFHNLENIDQFMADPWKSLVSFSGLTFYGGLICATVALWFYLKKYNISFWKCADVFSISLLYAYGIGRLGCHFAGDGDWGIVNTSPNPFPFLPDWWWSYTYPNNVLGVVLPEPVFPTPLYEALACILIAALFQRFTRSFRIPGVAFGIYFIIVGVERLLIEQIRVNTKYHLGNFAYTQAELISVVLILVGIVLIYLMRKKNKTQH